MDGADPRFCEEGNRCERGESLLAYGRRSALTVYLTGLLLILQETCKDAQGAGCIGPGQRKGAGIPCLRLQNGP